MTKNLPPKMTPLKGQVWGVTTYTSNSTSSSEIPPPLVEMASSSMEVIVTSEVSKASTANDTLSQVHTERISNRSVMSLAEFTSYFKQDCEITAQKLTTNLAFLNTWEKIFLALSIVSVASVLFPFVIDIVVSIIGLSASKSPNLVSVVFLLLSVTLAAFRLKLILSILEYLNSWIHQISLPFYVDTAVLNAYFLSLLGRGSSTHFSQVFNSGFTLNNDSSVSFNGMAIAKKWRDLGLLPEHRFSINSATYQFGVPTQEMLETPLGTLVQCVLIDISGKNGSTHVSFNGVVGELPYTGKPLKGNVYILHDALEERLGGTQADMLHAQTHEEGAKLVRLDHPTFENAFRVYATYQQEAFYLLTPDVMEQLLALRETFGAKLSLSFVQFEDEAPHWYMACAGCQLVPLAGKQSVLTPEGAYTLHRRLHALVDLFNKER